MDQRYQLVALLGQGGFGKVYLARDRLNGWVALKQLTSGRYGVSPYAHRHKEPYGSAMSLAREFEILASLRHPNIISVLDYGFDGRQRPYLVLELLKNAQTITEAGRGQPLHARVGLLVQMLQALLYLHRRGIIHRDLKPANVLVVDGQVKLLDFGLALTEFQQLESMRSGTPGYLAPEVLRGKPPSVRSDLYGVGVIAYELFLGMHPYARRSPRPGNPGSYRDRYEPPTQSHGGESDLSLLLYQLVAMEYDDEDSRGIEVPDSLEPGLTQVLRKLLAPNPQERFQSADAAITALCEATGQTLPIETAATRESFLQAARFVGRQWELTLLGKALTQAEREEQGGAWLLAGESGVGKSRLLAELRNLALVRGATVLHGQAIHGGSGPYHPWREILRGLTLLTRLDEREASIFKPLVPDIGPLLQRDIPDPEPLAAEAAHLRLLTTVEDVFNRLPRLTVLLLEDLQWADSATLSLLARLAVLAPKTRLLVVGSYRDDDCPRPPAELGSLPVLKLPRLSTGEISVLSESMMGAAGREPRVVSLLEHETEGNPFFLVEVLRALAEESGQLDHIGRAALPARMFVGGMRTLIERRLGKVLPAARELLRLAAILGRELHEELLHAAAPTLDLEGWLSGCADAAVLEVAGNRWRFAHDKLREGLLEPLAPADAARLHRQAAQLIEAVHPEDTAWVAALAHHWGAAGEPAKEALYSERAGEQALQVGACHEAIRFLQRALTLVESPPPGVGSRSHWRPRLGHLESLLAEAFFQLNNLEEFRHYTERAMGHFGHPLPTRGLGWALGTLGQVALRVLQRACPPAFTVRSEERRRARLEATQLCLRLSDFFIYQHQPLPLLWSGLRLLNLAEPAGPSAGLARGYAGMAVVASIIPLRRLARAWSKRALALADRVGHKVDQTFVLVRLGVVSASAARWSEAEAYLDRAFGLVEGVGDYRLAEECRNLRILLSDYQGRFARILPLTQWLQESARRRGADLHYVGVYCEAAALLRLGRTQEALARLGPILSEVESMKIPVNMVWVLGTLALASLRQGDLASARRAAKSVLEHSQSRPVAHFDYVGLSATLETYLLLREQAVREGAPPAVRAALEKEVSRACGRLRAFSQVFTFGKPLAWLARGSQAWHSGHPRRARWAWRRSISWARRLSMPYEEALARLALCQGLAADHPERREHCLHAIEHLTSLEARYNLDQAQALLASYCE
ncbi:serine/threonine-protein kinase PknK [Archangium sp.]|uniref:serine/threonine-protein kinase n=1 Tax=Archangium sp. TaxID=1872627 RepID=UPI002ED7C55F